MTKAMQTTTMTKFISTIVPNDKTPVNSSIHTPLCKRVTQ